MSNRLATAVAIAGLWAGSAIPALAADSGAVDAQVTVATPCITITNPVGSAIDFGTLPFSHDFTTSSANRAVSYTNCSSADQRVFGKGTDASGPTATWQLVAFNACNSGPNSYSIDALAPNEFGGDGTVAWLTTVDQELETVAAGSPGSIDNLMLAMPCVGSDGVGETMTFQVIFTATF